MVRPLQEKGKESIVEAAWILLALLTITALIAGIVDTRRADRKFR
jgi:hypothetical protein